VPQVAAKNPGYQLVHAASPAAFHLLVQPEPGDPQAGVLMGGPVQAYDSGGIGGVVLLAVYRA